MELRKSAKFIFCPKLHVNMKVQVTSEYESTFLSLILEANLCMVFEFAGPAPPVHEELIAKNMAFSTSVILCSYFSILRES